MYNNKTLKDELDLFDKVKVLECELDETQKELEVVKKERDLLQTDLNLADNEIRFLRGGRLKHINTYQTVIGIKSSC